MPKKIEKLLWHVPSTERPKSLSHSAGKEDAIVVTFFHMRMTIFGFESAANLIHCAGNDAIIFFSFYKNSVKY